LVKRIAKVGVSLFLQRFFLCKKNIYLLTPFEQELVLLCGVKKKTAGYKNTSFGHQ
jgi:hypothetical protein